MNNALGNCSAYIYIVLMNMYTYTHSIIPFIKTCSPAIDYVVCQICVSQRHAMSGR